jgi:hypothetical protein
VTSAERVLVAVPLPAAARDAARAARKRSSATKYGTGSHSADDESGLERRAADVRARIETASPEATNSRLVTIDHSPGYRHY